MKLSTNKTVVTKSNNIVQSSFGISKGNEAHILDILRNKLYSDKIGAVVREYSTNALDAQVEAGKGHLPIEISLPSRLNPVFSVKDNGIGLDEEEIRNTYVMYGASTKRDSNSFVGQLGLGCKAAFAYSDVFNIVSTKDKVRKTYSAYIDETKCGAIALLGEEKVEDDNGIEIKIPVKSDDFSSFRNKALEGLKYMNPTPLIDGEKQIDFTHEKEINIDGYRVGFNRGSWYFNAVMGSISYPIDLKELDISLHTPGFSLYLDIGDVDIAANRESLEYTEKTKSKLTEILSKVHNTVNLDFKNMIDNASNLREARKILNSYESFFSSLRLKANYKGIKVRSHPLPSAYSDEFSIFRRLYEAYIVDIAETGKKRYQETSCPYIYENMTTSYKILFIDIEDELQWKKKVSQWIAQQETEYDYYIAIKWLECKDEIFKDYALDDYEHVKVSELKIDRSKIVAAPRNENSKHKHKVFMYDHDYSYVYKESDAWLEVEDPDSIEGKTYYVEIDRFLINGVLKSRTLKSILSIMSKNHGLKPERIVGIKKNSKFKPKRGWIPLVKIIKKLVESDKEYSNRIQIKHNMSYKKLISVKKLVNSNSDFLKLMELLEEQDKETPLDYRTFHHYLDDLILLGCNFNNRERYDLIYDILSKYHFLKVIYNNISYYGTDEKEAKHIAAYIDAIDEINRKVKKK